MADHKCLATFPFDFIPGIRESFNAVLPTHFQEVWHLDEIPPDAGYSAWLMNPGQSFIIGNEVLEHFPSLEVLVTPSTGRNHIDAAACHRRGVAVYSLLDDRPGLETITSSAEFTFLLLLNTLRRLDLAVREVSEGRWRENEDLMRGLELAGKKVGLVGLGRIGRRMARYCTAFEASVYYHDPHVQDERYTALSLEELFSSCDALCVCPELNDSTRGMIGRELIARLKPGASLVNSSRGEVLNQADLLAVLRERPDLRVGLDVLAGEVTNTHLESPLVELHRAGQIVITPHIAGASVESQSKAAGVALGLLKRHLEKP